MQRCGCTLGCLDLGRHPPLCPSNKALPRYICYLFLDVCVRMQSHAWVFSCVRDGAPDMHFGCLSPLRAKCTTQCVSLADRRLHQREKQKRSQEKGGQALTGLMHTHRINIADTTVRRMCGRLRLQACAQTIQVQMHSNQSLNVHVACQGTCDICKICLHLLPFRFTLNISRATSCKSIAVLHCKQRSACSC